MPTGKTGNNKDASGALVFIYRDKAPFKFLTGEETDYVTDNKTISKTFRTLSGETIFEAFEAPGTVKNPEHILEAKKKFAHSSEQLEDLYSRVLGRVTYGNVKDSSKPGKISAKARHVKPERRDKFGFPKGSYEITDKTIEDTAVREVKEEIGINLDKSRLEDTKQQIVTGGSSNYAIFKYRLTDAEYKSVKTVLKINNSSREAELQSLKFRAIPAKYDDFFTNQASKKAYEKTFKKTPGGARRLRTLKNRRTN